MNLFKILFITFLLLDVSLVYSQCTTKTVALINGLIIDGISDEAQKGTVLICGERISEIGIGIKIPTNSEVIDLQGSAILPGLTDMHGHLYVNTGGTIQNEPSYLNLFLAGGITTIFSPGEYDVENTLLLQKSVRYGELSGPDILTAGPYFDNQPSRVNWIKGSNSASEIEEQFRRWKGKIDGVKVYINITEDRLQQIISLADKYNLPITGHLDSVSTIRAIELGIDGLEHGLIGMPELKKYGLNNINLSCEEIEIDFSDPKVNELISSIISSNTYIDPTIVALETMIPDSTTILVSWKRYLHEDVLDSYNRFESRINSAPEIQHCLTTVLDNQLKLIGELAKKGALIVTGTDPVSPKTVPGYALHRELELLVKAGLSRMEAIKAATRNPAIALRSEHEFGTIEIGKLANLLIVDGNPTINISDISNTKMVFKRGQSFNPDKLRSEVIGTIGASSN